MVADPYALDINEVNKFIKENTQNFVELICPKCNTSIGKPCAVCNYLQSEIYSQSFPKKHPAKVWAGERRARASFYTNIVLKGDPTKSFILKLGSKAGSVIIDGIQTKGWIDIANPLKGQGRELMVSKAKADGYNTYSISPVLNKADWEIPAETLQQIHNLDQKALIQEIKNSDLDSSVMMKVSSLKEGETLTFRMCPPWKNGELGDNNKLPFTFVHSHWKVSQDQIDGITPLNWKTDDTSLPTSAKENVGFQNNEQLKNIFQESQNSPKVTNNKPDCFGKADFFEGDSDICKECQAYKPCTAQVATQ